MTQLIPARTRLSRTARVVIALLFVATSTAACSTSEPNDAGNAGRGASSDTTELAAAWAKFRTAVDRPARPLTIDLGLQAPAGFTQSDVDALARRAISVLRRSTAPRLSNFDPDQAVDYVYQTQPVETKADFERDAIRTTQGRPWQAMAASRFPSVASAAKVIRVAASVKKYDGITADGTSAPYLAVTVEAHLVQEVSTQGGTPGSPTSVPIVSYRAVSASSFRPRGGADFWPAVRSRMIPYGNDGCALTSESTLLVPLTDPAVLREDLANLKSTLRSREVSSEFSFNSANLTEEARKRAEEQYREFRAERCEGRSQR